MNLLLERRAEIALRSLRGVDEKQVLRALHELTALDPRTFFQHPKIHKVLVSTSSPLYVYGRGMRLRLILSVDGENCKVLDIVDHDRLGRLLPSGGQ